MGWGQVEFGVLGPLEVTAGGQSLALAGARTRAVLALLLVHANQVVSSDRLLEELWPGQPTDRATDSLQVRLSELRKTLRSAGWPGHSSSSSRSDETTWLARTRSRASTARVRAPASARDWPPAVTSSGPRTPNSTLTPSPSRRW